MASEQFLSYYYGGPPVAPQYGANPANRNPSNATQPPYYPYVSSSSSASKPTATSNRANASTDAGRMPLGSSRRQNSANPGSATNAPAKAYPIPLPGRALRAATPAPDWNNPAAVAKAKLDQDDFVATRIMRGLDWNNKYPDEEPFKPFYFFDTEDVPSDIVAAQPWPGVRIDTNGTRLAGKVWQIMDKTTADKLEDFVVKDKGTIGCDLLFINGTGYAGKFFKEAPQQASAKPAQAPPQAAAPRPQYGGTYR